MIDDEDEQQKVLNLGGVMYQIFLSYLLWYVGQCAFLDTSLTHFFACTNHPTRAESGSFHMEPANQKADMCVEFSLEQHGYTFNLRKAFDWCIGNRFPTQNHCLDSRSSSPHFSLRFLSSAWPTKLVSTQSSRVWQRLPEASVSRSVTVVSSRSPRSLARMSFPWRKCQRCCPSPCLR